jgi:hypothetical protein
MLQNNNATVDIFEPEVDQIPTSGVISSEFQILPFLKKHINSPKIMGSILLLAVTTTTDISLPEMPYDHYREIASSYYAERLKGQQITLMEARQIAFSVLYEAERRREETAKKEANIIAIWEEDE